MNTSAAKYAIAIIGPASNAARGSHVLDLDLAGRRKRSIRMPHNISAVIAYGVPLMSAIASMQESGSSSMDTSPITEPEFVINSSGELPACPACEYRRFSDDWPQAFANSSSDSRPGMVRGKSSILPDDRPSMFCCESKSQIAV